MASSLSLFIVLLLATTAALAQIAPSSPGSQRAANRRALREARQTEAPYADSHLATSRQLKRGAMVPIGAVAGEPSFGRDGQPHVTEPKYPGLRLRKHKFESLR
ncbi:MAG: hypothetical protein ACRYGH_12660 [Janthinobacterium lividum]